MRARYFDGRTARATSVELEARAGALWLEGDGCARAATLAELEIGEPGLGAIRILRLRDGSHCEAEDGSELQALLAAIGHRDGFVARSQQRWSTALAAIAALGALGAVAYFVALPLGAEWLARRLPERTNRVLGRHTLALLDESEFAASDLPRERQAELRERFAALQPSGDALPRARVRFRAADRLGANALALPGNLIVFTDDLVALADDDDALAGVYAHELGHLAEHHPLRSLIQGSAIGLATAIYLGDVSSLAAGLAAFALETRYSRAFEREADRFAAELLHANGVSTQPLADLLAELDREALAAGDDPDASGFLATHPHTAERIRALREE